MIHVAKRAERLAHSSLTVRGSALVVMSTGAHMFSFRSDRYCICCSATGLDRDAFWHAALGLARVSCQGCAYVETIRSQSHMHTPDQLQPRTNST